MNLFYWDDVQREKGVGSVLKNIKMRVKIMSAITFMSFIIAVGLGWLTVSKSENLLEDYAYRDAQLQVENNAKDLNTMIEKIESSVDGLAVTTLSTLDDVNRLQTDPQYRKDFQEKIRPIAEQFAAQTEGAMGFYLRYNPTFSEPTSGLFYADTENDGNIRSLTPTDFSQFDKDDAANVGWYYIPMNEGKPTWMDPYVNDNIGVEMISYVIPLMKDGVEVGVVGMDIRFDIFSEAVAEMKPHDSSYGMLLNRNKQFLIHPSVDQLTDISERDKTIAQKMDETPSDVLSLKVDKEPMIVSYSKLANDQYLVLASSKKEVYASITEMKQIVLFVVLGAIVVSVIVAWLLSKQLTNPIQRLVDDMKKVQNGDLTVQTEIVNNDEVGEIASNFNQMTTQLRDMARQIDTTAEQVQSASRDLSHIAEETAASSSEVTKSMEDIADGSTELAHFVQNGASITRQLSDEFDVVSHSIEDIRATMEQMTNQQNDSTSVLEHLVATTNENEEATAHINEVIARLNGRMETIVSVIGTIQAIAEQTNLLALNAAIESARAGEVGQGFAVVANEIRTLADQSRESTEDIRQIIENIYADTSLTVDAMSEVTTKTTEQTKAVDTVRASMLSLNESTSAVTTLVNTSIASIQQLNEEAGTLANEIESMSAISEEQAATSTQATSIMQSQREEIAKVNEATQRLHDLVNELQQMVHTFKL